MSAELVIKGGTVVDGTGAPGVRADVAISDGRISEIGTNLTGGRTLDASGHVVAPGFIDIHTHYDAQVFWDPALTPSCYHGVTTVVAGNCGFSIAPTRPEHRELIARTLENVEDMNVASLAAGIPWDFETFGEYLDSVARHGVGVNFAAYVGHTALRLYSMGDDAYERAATPQEIERMQEVLRQSLEAGAAGFATSFAGTHRGVDGKPVPSRQADDAELRALLEVVGAARRGVVSIAPGDQCRPADMGEMQRRTGVPFTWGALLTMASGGHRETLELTQRAWADGADVWPQVTPRALGFSMLLTQPFFLNMNSQFASLMSSDLGTRRHAYADDAWRRRTEQVWAEGIAFSTPRWHTYEIDESPSHPELVGQRLATLAAARSRGPVRHPARPDPRRARPGAAGALRAGQRRRGRSGQAAARGPLHPRAVRRRRPRRPAVRRPAGPRLPGQLGPRPRPDGAGAGRPQAHPGPGRPVRHPRRAGVLAPGAWADVVVFDPDTVSPGPLRRLRDFPADAERLTADQPTGVRHILVNGTPTQLDGVRLPDAVGAGQVVRPGPRPA